MQKDLKMQTTAARPYSPSWLNRLINWIEDRPGPAWPYYLAGTLLLGPIPIVASWLLGETPFGSFSVPVFLNAIYPIYFVALMHYLDGEAKSALAKFRPILQVNDSDYADLEYKLTTVPA